MYEVKLFGREETQRFGFPTLKDALHFVRFVLEYYQITLPDGEIISRCDLED